MAIFDLDGTITRHDTLVPYLWAALKQHPARGLRLWSVPGMLIEFAVRGDRGVLKSRLIRAVLGGWSRTRIELLTQRFLDQQLSRLTRPGALAAIERHRAAGDHLVLLSASTDFYVVAIGARLGFDEVICTEVRWQGERLDGSLRTANRHGEEKTHCVRAVQERHPGARVAAYGNAGSDLPHLSTVDAPTLVNANARTERRARKLGIPTNHWT